MGPSLSNAAATAMDLVPELLSIVLLVLVSRLLASHRLRSHPLKPIGSQLALAAFFSFSAYRLEFNHRSSLGGERVWWSAWAEAVLPLAALTALAGALLDTVALAYPADGQPAWLRRGLMIKARTDARVTWRPRRAIQL